MSVCVRERLLCIRVYVLHARASLTCVSAVDANPRASIMLCLCLSISGYTCGTDVSLGRGCWCILGVSVECRSVRVRSCAHPCWACVRTMSRSLSASDVSLCA